MPRQRKTNFDFTRLMKDEKAFGDDLMIRVGDSDVPLGDLRAYNEQTGGDLAAELDRRAQALAVDQGKVQQASEAVAKLYTDLEAQKAAFAQERTHQPLAPGSDPLAAYEADPVFGPVMKQLKTVESGYKSEFGEMSKKLDQVVRSIAQMGTTYMGDKATKDFSDIMSKDDPVRPKDLNLDSLYKFAVEQRVYDRNNLPDLKTAYERLTAPQRHTYEVQQAEQRGREAMQREINEGAMLPRPVSGLPPLPEGFKPPRNLNDAMSRAGQDRDLFKEIMNASTPILGGSIQ